MNRSGSNLECIVDDADRRHFAPIRQYPTHLERSFRSVHAQLRLPPGASELPDHGHLRLSSLFGQIDLVRRRQACLEDIRTNSDLSQALLESDIVDQRSGVPTVAASEERLDEFQFEVLSKAAKTRMCLVQGPPGTGKTRLAVEYIASNLAGKSGQRILFTSQSHTVVDQSISAVFDRLEERSDIDDEDYLIIRVSAAGRAADSPVSLDAIMKKLLLDATDALRDSDLQSARRLRDACAVALRGGSSVDLAAFERQVVMGADVVFLTATDRDVERGVSRLGSFDTCVYEEAAKAHIFELLCPLRLASNWILIGDHRQLPPFHVEQFRKRLDATTHLKSLAWDLLDADPGCRNVDGLVLNAIQRADQIELKQIAERDWRPWLETFASLFDSMGSAEDNSVYASGLLSRQHRMHPAIGGLISKVFYEDKVTDAEDRLGTRHAPSDLVGLPDGSPALLWLDIGDSPESSEPRYTNEREIERIVEYLRWLAETGPALGVESVAVLSAYQAQVSRLSERLRTERFHEKLNDAGIDLVGRKLQSGHRLAFTIDGFQGNEADLVLLSLVRSNDRVQNPVGFLDLRRANVGLSRARKVLILAGSYRFFRRLEPGGHNPNNGVWAEVMNYWDLAVASGEAAFRER